MDNFEIAKEAVNLYFDGFSARESIVKANEMCLGVDQNNQDTKKNDFNNILPPGVDLDNNQVYLENTGDTLGDIEEVFGCK
ncbi:hypothetical protein [Clostridium sp. Ade.TY]|uniref:hypothetical protein n=1 Tax=Clostridium sp. Ade.TY TaxID=1391647 RepID=UPI0003FF6DC5|nr:hypothetical protein [Clostridium sp. Ade.TY]